MRTDVVWAVAATDTLARAGLFADLATVSAHGGVGRGIVTAVTAQSDDGRMEAFALGREAVTAQFDAAASAGAPAAVKLGAVPGDGAEAAVTAWLAGRVRAPVVWDPVLATSAGAPLTDAAALGRRLEAWLPAVALVTPNVPEAARLSGRAVADRDGAHAAAERLLAAGARAVLLKGGHAPWAEGEDLWATRDGSRWLEGGRLERVSARGTGCRLSTAIACGLAAGVPLERAVADARRWLRPRLLCGPDG